MFVGAKLLEPETFDCILLWDIHSLFYDDFSYEIMFFSGLIKLCYNAVMPCAAVLLQPTNNYIFMPWKFIYTHLQPHTPHLKLYTILFPSQVVWMHLRPSNTMYSGVCICQEGFTLDTIKGISFQIGHKFGAKNCDSPIPRYAFISIITSEKKHGMGGDFKKWIQINMWSGWSHSFLEMSGGARVVSTNKSFSIAIFNKKPSYACNSFQ